MAGQIDGSKIEDKNSIGTVGQSRRENGYNGPILKVDGWSKKIQ